MELNLKEAEIAAIFDKGLQAHNAGDLNVAEQLYQETLAIKPEHPEANHNMGVLAVGIGKVQEALPFFKIAVEANPAAAQFWLSYIDALIKLERLADAKAVFDQVKSKGAKDDGYDNLEQRLSDAQGEPLDATTAALEKDQTKSNILDSLNLEQAIKLAKKKTKEGFSEEATRIYQDILTKFPKNKRASDGLKTLVGGSVRKAFKLQDPTQDQLQSLINLHSQGQLRQTLQQIEALVQQFPMSAVLYNIQGAVLQELGQLDLSIEAYSKALTIKPNYTAAYYNMGNALKEQGKLEEAIEAYNKALAIKPDHSDASYNMAYTFQEQGKLEEAIATYKKVLAIKPDYVDAYNNMGNALKEQGKLEEAIAAYNKALAIKPDYVDAYNNMGVALKEKCKLGEAIEAYKKALAIKPDYADAYNNMGNALKEQGKLKEAIEAYNKALAIKPDYVDAYNNMGVALKEKWKLGEAIEAYKKALAIKPDYADVYNNMGNALQEQGSLEEAIEAYNEALAIQPDHAEAYYNMGYTFQEQGKLEEAIATYNKAIALKPDHAEAYYNMGITIQCQGKLEEAIAAFNNALALQPDYETARGQKLYQLAHICDWDAIAEDSTLIPSLGTNEKFVPPFVMLSLEDAPDSHRIRSEVYAKAIYLQRPLPLPALPSKKPKRIRIGYFSADFHNHATMYLMAKVFAAHDRQKFEVYAYSYGPDANDQMRQALIKSVDVFDDVREMSFKDTALLARQDKIDIAVDLKGHTQDQRLGIFAYRPAPTQISYLGYPGTIGAEFIDYMVADPVVVPSNRRSAYSEEIIYLPHTYQPNDNTRIISQKVTTKADMGLPEDGFVFCCFNSNYKISPAEFDIWMRLLCKVNGSVLWLLKSNLWVEQNLQREAKKRGIQANRLVFAEKLPHDQHLGRQKHADLFIDTFNVNAHTTASDALWAGLPIVTKLGQGFAARVAGSLLNAVGLAELITENEHDYEALILELATNPVKLAKIKEKLAVNRLSQPLFDTQQYTKHLEDGYQQAYQTYFEGKVPQTIVVSR